MSQFDWMLLSPGGQTELVPGAKGTYAYNLLNLTVTKKLRYGSREYGINLVWDDPDNDPVISVVRPGGGAAVLRHGDLCAVGVEGGGYLRYKEREYGINLVWSSEPVFEWYFATMSGAGDVPVGTAVVALYNTVRKDYLFYDPRRYGINLKWLSDKGKHNSKPWYEEAWDTATGVLSDLWNGITQLGNWALSALDAVLTFFGIMLPKKLRLRVIILRDEKGEALLLDERQSDAQIAADQARLDAAIQHLRDVFGSQLNTSIVSAGGEMIRVLDFPAPSEALDVGCGGDALGESVSEAGRYFREKEASNWHGTIVGYGAPVTVFVVRDVEGKLGCSLGPLTNYVTVDVEGFEYDDPSPPVIDDVVVPTPKPPSTLAHEVGHACSLWHPLGWPESGRGNLMYPDVEGRGKILELHQRSVARASKHITFF